MNKKRYYEALVILNEISSGDSCNNLSSAIEIFSELVEYLPTQPKFLAEGSEGQQYRQNSARKANQIILEEKKLSHFSVMGEVHKVTNQLKQCRELYADIDRHNLVTGIERLLHEFVRSYERHTRDYSHETCLNVSIKALPLRQAFRTISVFTATALAVYDPDPEDTGTESDKKRVDLYLSNVATLNDFAVKLTAINNIYMEILCIFDVNLSDYPIQVKHLENGSLLISILGHSLTALLLTNIIAIAAEIYQNEYSKTGKIHLLSETTKTTNDLLDIRMKLAECGIDCDKDKDKIDKLINKSYKQLDILLSDQPEIEINSKKLSVSDHHRQKMIEESQRKRLEALQQNKKS